MIGLRNKGFIAVISFVFAMTPAWSKSFYGIASFLTETGRLDPEYVSAILSYSPPLIVLDIISSILIIYYLKKYVRKRASR